MLTILSDLDRLLPCALHVSAHVLGACATVPQVYRKTKEVAAPTSTIEAKTKQIRELGVSSVVMGDLADTQDALAGAMKLLAAWDKRCATKTAEWEERSKTRTQDWVAVADTFKVLNHGGAMECFKRTLPSASASLLQIEGGQRSSRRRRCGLHNVSWTRRERQVLLVFLEVLFPELESQENGYRRWAPDTFSFWALRT